MTTTPQQFPELELAIDYGQNDSKNLQTMACNSTYLYTADNRGHLYRYDIIGKFLDIDYGKIESKEIQKIVCSPDNQWLFISTDWGMQRQISCKSNSLVKNYGKVLQRPMIAMACTLDSQFLFFGDKRGYMKQLNIKNQEIAHDHDQIHKTAITSMVCTKNFVFTADNEGNLQQTSIISKNLVKNYGQISKGSLYAITATNDDQFIFTGDYYGNVKQFSIANYCEVRDLGRLLECAVHNIAASPSSVYLYIQGSSGDLQQWSITEQKVMKTYEKVSKEDKNDGLVISKDSQYLFTSNYYGFLKQFYYNKNRIQNAVDKENERKTSLLGDAERKSETNISVRMHDLNKVKASINHDVVPSNGNVSPRTGNRVHHRHHDEDRHGHRSRRGVIFSQ